MTQGDDGAWFAPKQVGYGAGLPIRWQGWVLLALHLSAIGLTIAVVPRDRPLVQLGAVLLVAALPMPLIARKTRGGWRWRNGEKP